MLQRGHVRRPVGGSGGGGGPGKAAAPEGDLGQEGGVSVVEAMSDGQEKEEAVVVARARQLPPRENWDKKVEFLLCKLYTVMFQ
ncbi:hypothetical protein J6590_069641 [Homalodisca vitripennis]|nr:hypothetical protein J6590_069641 [Homalodisca vitripennis]